MVREISEEEDITSETSIFLHFFFGILNNVLEPNLVLRQDKGKKVKLSLCFN
jgi:hypothetical protein